MKLGIKKTDPKTKKKKSFIKGLSKILPSRKTKQKNEKRYKKQKYYVPPTRHTTTTETKVFKPKNSDLFKEKVKNKTFGGFKQKRKLKFGHKTPVNFNPGDGSLKNLPKKINYLISKYRVLERFNFLIVFFITIAISGFIFYLCFFDTYFLVKKYKIVFAENSYIDNENLTEITDRFGSKKFLGFVPNNQFWFLNEDNLTRIAKDKYPEIISVEVKERKWPNTTTLEITTEPTLITLGINNNEYWRISKNGRILGKDDIGLRENLVIVEAPITISEGVNRGSFADYPLENKEQQKEKFWFIIKLWQWLEEANIQHVKTVIPSLSDYDNNIIIHTDQGTKLLFDIYALTEPQQETRVKTILEQTEIGIDERNGKLDYIDFRVPKKIYWCDKGRKCAD